MSQNQDWSQLKNELYRFGRDIADEANNLVKEFQNAASTINISGATKPVSAPPPKKPLVLYGKGPNRTAGIVKTVAGSLLTGCFGLAFFGLSVIGTLGPELLLDIGLSVCLPPTLVGAGLLTSGLKTLKRTERFQSYIQRIGQKQICAIKTLSDTVGKSEAFVRKEVKALIADGSFRQGHLDDEGSCLMLTDETYNLYQISKEQTRLAKEKQREENDRMAREAREKERQRAKENAFRQEKSGTSNISGTGAWSSQGSWQQSAKINGKENKNSAESSDKTWSTKDPKMQEILNEGMNYIRIIREANDALPGPEISKKLDKLEKIIGLIYIRLQKHPERLDSLKRFTDYYLPTTIKLVKSYCELEHSEVETPNMRNSKAQIEETLDTVNQAFEKMLDSMYEEDTIDITTDIQVLQTLLAQEGLTGLSFADMQADLRQEHEKE